MPCDECERIHEKCRTVVDLLLRTHPYNYAIPPELDSEITNLLISEGKLSENYSMEESMSRFSKIDFEGLYRLSYEIHKLNCEKGFYDEAPTGSSADPTTLIAKLGLVVTEVAETIEAVRKPGISDKVPELTREEEEIADTLIRILDYCGYKGIRVGKAVRRKLDYNMTRDYKHGKLA